MAALLLLAGCSSVATPPRHVAARQKPDTAVTVVPTEDHGFSLGMPLAIAETFFTVHQGLTVQWRPGPPTSGSPTVLGILGNSDCVIILMGPTSSITEVSIGCLFQGGGAGSVQLAFTTLRNTTIEIAGSQAQSWYDNQIGQIIDYTSGHQAMPNTDTSMTFGGTAVRLQSDASETKILLTLTRV